jgi:hypothetical protein
MIALLLPALTGCSTFDAEYECKVGDAVEVSWAAEVGCGGTECWWPQNDEVKAYATPEEIETFRAHYFSDGDPIPSEVPDGWEFLVQGQFCGFNQDTGGCLPEVPVEDFRLSPKGDRLFVRLASTNLPTCNGSWTSPEGIRAWLVHSTLPAEPCWKCKTD